MGTLHKDQHKVLIISRSIIIRMQNVSDKRCREKQNILFMFNNFFFFVNRAVYKMWKNNEESDRSTDYNKQQDN